MADSAVKKWQLHADMTHMVLDEKTDRLLGFFVPNPGAAFGVVVSSIRKATWALIVLGWLAGFASSGLATTIVPMTDEDLAVSVRAIVEGTVLRSEAVLDRDRGEVFTYVTVDVDRVLKGSVVPGPLVFKQFGGMTAHEVSFAPDTPEFRAGTRVLLFLNTDSNGVLRVAQFSLGAYRVETDPATGIETAARYFPQSAAESDLRRSAPMTDIAPLSEFVGSIESILATNPGRVAEFDTLHADVPVVQSPPEYPARRAAADSTTPSFSFLPPGFRWFESDTGGAVMMRVNLNKAPTPSRGVDESKLGLEAWSSVTGSAMRMALVGQTKAGGRVKDGVSSISFGDPLDEMDDPVAGTLRHLRDERFRIADRHFVDE